MTPLPYYAADSVYSPVRILERVSSFATLIENELFVPVQLSITRADYDAAYAEWESAPKEERAAAKQKFFKHKNSPCIFAGVFTAPGVTHQKKLVTACHLVTVDVDDSDDAQRILQKSSQISADLCANFLAYHTISSRPGRPRLRVIVDTENFAPEFYPQAAHYVCDRLGISRPNPESLDPSRPMFKPAVFAGEAESPIITWDKSNGPLAFATFKDYPISETPTEADFECADLEHLPVAEMPLETVEGMLAKLDPDMDRPGWVKVAMALKHQFASDKDLNRKAFHIFDNWSSKGVKYQDTADCRTVWRSIRGEELKTTPVTIRSLIKLARAAGWNDENVFDQAHEAFKKKIESAKTPGAVSAILKEIAQHPLVTETAETSLCNVARLKMNSLGRDVDLPAVKKEMAGAHKKIKEEAKKERLAAPAPRWAKDVVFVKAVDKFISLTSFKSVRPEAFNRAHLHECMEAGIELEPSRYVLGIVGAPVVYDSAYAPEMDGLFFEGDDGERYFNIFKKDYPAPDAEHAQEALDRIRFHFMHVLTNGDERVADLLLSWMAWIAQNPGGKVTWSPFLTGPDGTGKSLISVWMRAALGSSNVRPIGNDTLNKSWTEWVGTAQLLVFDETVVSKEKMHVMEKLKSLVTETFVAVETRFQNTSTVKNRSNMIFCSNHQAGLILTPTDRRFFVVSVKAKDAESIKKEHGKDYFVKLHQLQLDPAWAAGLRYALLNLVQLHPEFEHWGNAPVTADREVVVEAGGNEIRKGLQHLFESEESPWIRADIVVSPRTLRPLRELCSRSISIHMVADELKKLGFIKLPSSPLIVDKREATWVHESWDRGLLGDPAKALRDRVGAVVKLDEI